MKAIRKDFVREIRHTLSRFLSILILVSLAVAFLSGLRSTAPDMKNTCDTYLDEQSFMDVQILATLGLTDEDISVLRSQPGISAVEPAYVLDAYAHMGTVDVVTKVYSLPHQLNQLTVLEGRMPQAPDECVVDSLLVNRMGLELGTSLKFLTEGELEDALLPESFKVVGVVRSPLYISPERGTSTLGTGQVSAFAYVPEEAVDLDFYTAAFLTADGAAELTTFSPAYSDLMDQVLDQLEPIGKDRARLRRESLVDEGNEKLADAEQELADAKADAEQELSDAEAELADARRELDDGWRELKDGKHELATETADAEQEIADAEADLSDALVELQDGEAEYADGLLEYEDGLKEYEEGLAEYEDGRKDYEKGLAAFEDAEGQLENGRESIQKNRAALEQARQQLEQGEAQYQAALDALNGGGGNNPSPDPEGGETTPTPDPEGGDTTTTPDPDPEGGETDPTPNPEGGETPPAPDPEDGDTTPTPDPEGGEMPSNPDSEGDAAEAQYHLSAVLVHQNPYLDQLAAMRASLDAGWAQYNEGMRQLDAGSDEWYSGAFQLEQKRPELKKAKEELESAKADLEDARIKLEDAKADLEDARTELDDGWQEYNDGLQELADAKQELPEKIADAKAELADAERDLREGEAEYRDGYQEYLDGKAEAEEKISDAEEEIADAHRKLADIGDSEWYILDRDSNPGYLGFGQDADRMANLASVFPVLFFLVAALVCLTTMTRMVDEQRVQIGCLKALGYSRWAISRKYLGYGFLPSLLGGILGLAIGFTLFPRMIFTAYQIMYEVPDIQLSVYPGISILSLLAAVGCTTVSSLAACMNALRETPAALMRPRAPKAGKRILLEYIKPLWRHMSFSHKVTARNLLRYQKRFWMTVIGIGGCTALIIAGFGLRSSLLATMEIQYDDIFHYTAQVATEENLLDSERQAIDSYVAENQDILDSLPCRISSITAESDTYNTSAYLEVVDPERIHDFVLLQTYRHREPLAVPDDGVIIDQKLSELLDLQVGDTLISDDGETRAELRVAAINENYLAHFIYLSPAYYEQVYGEPPAENAYLMTFSDSNMELCDSIFTDLMELHGVVAASRMLSTRDTYMSAMERIDFVVVIVILSAAALALVVLYNLSNINITERRRELATIRVLGFYDGEVSAYVNRENLVLTIFGILFGIGAGRLLHSWLVRSVEIDLMMFGRETDPMAYLWAALLTALFSAAVALMSHQKMKKIDMVESLKSAE